MTLETMQGHEMVTLRYEEDDYRRASLVRLTQPHVRGAHALDMRWTLLAPSARLRST